MESLKTGWLLQRDHSQCLNSCLEQAKEAAHLQLLAWLTLIVILLLNTAIDRELPDDR